MDLKEVANYLKIDNVKSDIKQIEYYANEESNLLKNIATHYKNVKRSYVSPNTSKFNTLGDSILEKRDSIKLKRGKYNEVLQRNIDIYIDGRNTTIAMFSKDGDDDNE